jgi:hypothetical protein
MKKIIRLTESELIGIVKKIINENDSMDDLIPVSYTHLTLPTID